MRVTLCVCVWCVCVPSRQRAVKEIYSPNQKLLHGWKCSVNDVIKLSPLWCCDLSHNFGNHKRTTTTTGTNFHRLSCMAWRACMTVPIPCRESKQTCAWIFSFSPRMWHKPVAVGDDALHRQAIINMANYTLCELGAVVLVNIFAGHQVVIAMAAPHSPGLLEMNRSISHVSLCICADRKHDRLHFGTSLNKSLEGFRRERKDRERHSIV